MEIIQINGQKIWGPPRNWTGPPPPFGTEIYIKNLPDDVPEVELFEIFSTIGRVYEVRLPVHWSGGNRGYAFVRFTKISEADAAIKAYDGFEIRNGRQIKIERSVDNTRLFLSSVPNYKTGEEIKSDLQTVVDNVKRVYVYPTLENPLMFRGYAFVEFKSHRDAAIAKRILTPDTCFNLFEKKCIAAWANPLPFLNENIIKTINILFMRNVPKVKSTTIKKTIENLLKDNSIVKVKRLNDFAFLTFKNHETAKAALNIIKSNPGLFGDHNIQVEWAVPKELTNIHANETDFGENGKKLDSLILHKKRRGILPSIINEAEAKKLLKVDKDIDYNNSESTDHRQHSEYARPIVSTDENKFREIIEPKKQFAMPVVLQKQTGELVKFFNGISRKINSSHITNSIVEKNYSDPKSETMLTSVCQSKSLYGSKALNVFEVSEGTKNLWNLSPNSDIDSHELEELFRNLQTKSWPGNLVYSSCSSSPSLTVSSTESPVHWNNDESNILSSVGNRFLVNNSDFSINANFKKSVPMADKMQTLNSQLTKFV